MSVDRSSRSRSRSISVSARRHPARQMAMTLLYVGSAGALICAVLGWALCLRG
jgi:hypothetical protein